MFQNHIQSVSKHTGRKIFAGEELSSKPLISLIGTVSNIFCFGSVPSQLISPLTREVSNLPMKLDCDTIAALMFRVRIDEPQILRHHYGS